MIKILEIPNWKNILFLPFAHLFPHCAFITFLNIAYNVFGK